MPERPPLDSPPARAKEKPERGADGGATERDAVEKLRAGVAVGRTLEFGTRIAAVEVGAATRTLAGETVMAATRALVAGAPELTKRCAAASYAIDEPPPRATLRVAALPPAIVRSMRAGAVVLTIRELIVFVGTDFTDFHSAPVATGASLVIAPLDTGNTP